MSIINTRADLDTLGQSNPGAYLAFLQQIADATVTWSLVDGGWQQGQDLSALGAFQLGLSDLPNPRVSQPTLPASYVAIIHAVSIVQARIALRRAGLLPAIDAYVDQEGGEVADRWHYGTTLQRDDPMLAAAAAALYLSEQRLDDLFAAAATL
ncbi:MAG: hypothetical protein GC168_20690 [Candidatus Hydrogenedens sp.]|nr:hypothetical protein [Candidatus Hydrogenedens sp.]